MTATKRITEILFTYATNCYCVRHEGTPDCPPGSFKGADATVSPCRLKEMVGEDEYDRLSRIAFQLTGHWHKAD